MRTARQQVRAVAAARRILLVGAVAAILSGCTGSTATNGPSNPANPNVTVDAGVELAMAHVDRLTGSADDARQAAAAMNAFGVDLFVRAAANGGNVVVSPTSIALALAMARAGARGETASQMDAVLRDVGADARAGGLSALDRALAAVSGSFADASGKKLDVTLNVANAPFAQRDMRLEPAYVDALGARFGAGLRLVDYRANAEGARKLVNGWVSEKTKQRIPELIGQGLFDASTRLTLVNAVYLKAPWMLPFPKSATEELTFTRRDGSSVKVPMMHHTTSLPFANGIGYVAAELPYVGDRLAMLVIVPDDLASFEKHLDGATLDGVAAGLSRREVRVTLPKFKLETKTDLADVLAAMGMPLAFAGGADFSGITTEQRLCISDVIHQANIDVDEAGTEAAAATAVVMAGAMPAGDKIAELRADRPFLFALRDRETGAVLFLGRVADPSKG